MFMSHCLKPSEAWALGRWSSAELGYSDLNLFSRCTPATAIRVPLQSPRSVPVHFLYALHCGGCTVLLSGRSNSLQFSRAGAGTSIAAFPAPSPRSPSSRALSYSDDTDAAAECYLASVQCRGIDFLSRQDHRKVGRRSWAGYDVWIRGSAVFYCTRFCQS